MTSPTPYNSLMTSLTVVVEKFSTLPRLSCTPMRNNGRSHSKPDHQTTRAHNTQQQMSAFMSVLRQATRYRWNYSCGVYIDVAHLVTGDVKET